MIRKFIAESSSSSLSSLRKGGKYTKKEILSMGLEFSYCYGDWKIFKNIKDRAVKGELYAFVSTIEHNVYEFKW